MSEFNLETSIVQIPWFVKRVMRKVKWDILKSKTHSEVNELQKLDKVKFYMDCDFIVLPTHHPIFTSKGVACSCRLGFTCHSIGKHPVIAYKHLMAHNYPSHKEYIKSFFIQNPSFNIGFKVSGFSILDLDYQRGAKDSFAKMKQTFPTRALDNVTSVTTPNGIHLYVDNTELPNNSDIVAEGLDVRSEGGFIVAAGSTHKTGKTYDWNIISEVGRIPTDWITVVDKGLRRTPAGEKNKQNSSKLKNYVLPKEITPDYRIKEGSRNNILFKWACRERGKGADKELLFDILTTIRDSCCDDPDSITDLELKSMADRVADSYLTEAQKHAS